LLCTFLPISGWTSFADTSGTSKNKTPNPRA